MTIYFTLQGAENGVPSSFSVDQGEIEERMLCLLNRFNNVVEKENISRLQSAERIRIISF